MVKFLIDGAAASVKVEGDFETIVAEIAYGIKIVKESFEKNGDGDEFSEVMRQAVEIVLEDEDKIDNKIDKMVEKAVKSEDCFESMLNKLPTDEMKLEFAKTVLEKMREQK